MSAVLSSRLVSATLLVGAVLALVPAPAVAKTTVHTGTIASGPQFDLYTFALVGGTVVEARLICAELTPGNRPLDPVLSVYFPGSDSSDTINADVFNDDGFGLDDHPEGVDCNAFDSSRVHFRVPETGTFTLRADGFGSSTGPYTLRVVNVSRTDLDFDGDDKADIGVFRQSTGTFLYQASSNQEIREVCCESAGDQPVPGDYDNDLKTDIAAFRPSTGTVFIHQSTHETSPSVPEVVERPLPDSQPGDTLIPADYDGDGLTDIGVFRQSGEFVVVRSSDGTVLRACCAATSLGDRPIPGDYDGDGKIDFAVYRASVGAFLILNSSTSTLDVRCCAAPSDIPVPADYDDDFKTDVAVYRAASGTFFVLQSSDGTVASHLVTAPQPGDVPIHADYDGDGKTDAAIYRTSTGEFFIRRSSDGGLTQQAGGSPALGDVPIKRQ